MLTKNDICVGRMLTLDEVEHDPQIRARNMIVEVEAPSGEKVKQVGISVKLSETPGSIRSLAPKLGQHTDEILSDLGYNQHDIDRWRAEGRDSLALDRRARRVAMAELPKSPESRGLPLTFIRGPLRAAR